MRAAVDDVHHRHWQHFGVRAADVLVEWKAHGGGGRLGHGQRHAEDSVRSALGLRLRAINFEHRLVDPHLVGGVRADQGVSQFIVHGIHCFQHAFAGETLLVAVAQLQCLVFSGAGTGRDCRTAHGAAFDVNIHFNSGIAA